MLWPLVFVTIGASTALIFAYLLFIWWLDRYEREPLWLVGLAFIWGGLGGTCLGCFINSSVGIGLQLAGPKIASFLTTVVVAPITEEATKALIFLILVLSRHLDNETDGLIYGAATGLGFAVVENLFYYQTFILTGQTEGIFQTIIIRTLFTSLVHCIASALLGMTIGYARHRSGAGRWLIWPVLGYALAVITHGTWNLLATLSGLGQGAQILLWAAILLVLIAAAVMFGLTQWSLKREHDVICRFLMLESERGVLPVEHAAIIPYWLKRRRNDWLPAHIPKESYIRTATLLAFRHHQLEIAQGERRQRYLEDIAKFRTELRALNRGMSV